MKKNHKVQGQSLVELIFSFFIMALIIVAIVGLATVSVRNSSYARNNTRARTYAQETIEWLRGMRDNLKWNQIRSKGVNNSKIYCVTSLGDFDIPGWSSSVNVVKDGCREDEIILNSGMFYRKLLLLRVDENTLDAKVTVYWNDEKGYHEVSVSTRLTNWN